MGQLKDTIVSGNLRVTDDILANKINGVVVGNDPKFTDSGEKVHKAYTSNGTTATTDAGKTYGTVGDATSGQRIFTKWFVNLDTGVTTLTDGMIISFRMPTAGLTTCGECITIDGNEQHFHQVVYNTNSYLTTHFAVNSIITVQYDASISSSTYGQYNSSTGKYVHNGNNLTDIQGVWRVLSLYNSDTDVRYQQTLYYPRKLVATGGAICRYTLCMQTPDGKLTSLTLTNNSQSSTTKTMFSGYLDYRKVYYWGHTDTFAAGADITRNNVLLSHQGDFIDFRYTFNCGTTLTARSNLYIVGTIDNNGFKLDTTQPWSCSLPNTDDGKVYIYVGMVYSDTSGYRGMLEEVNTAYWYKNGRVQVYSDYAKNADLLDGNHASAFATSGHTHNGGAAKTAWGQTYVNAAGTLSSISGNMSSVGTISASGDNNITKSSTEWAKFKATNNNGSVSLGSSTNRGVYDETKSWWIIGTNTTGSSIFTATNSTTNLGVGTLSPSSKLHVNGDVTIGGETAGSKCRQQYDTTNKCLKFIFE